MKDQPSSTLCLICNQPSAAGPACPPCIQKALSQARQAVSAAGTRLRHSTTESARAGSPSAREALAASRQAWERAREVWALQHAPDQPPHDRPAPREVPAAAVPRSRPAPTAPSQEPPEVTGRGRDELLELLHFYGAVRK